SENIFTVQKIENKTVYEDVEINSKILELPEKIVEYVKMIKSNDMKTHSVIIHLDPPNLGKIKLKVLMEANKVRAEMNIANSITKEIIEAQLPDIRRSLMQYNIHLSEFNVILDNNNPKNSSQNLLQQEKWSTQTWLYDRNNENKGNEEQKRRYARFISSNSLVDLLT
ncbi:MAG: flagellar hook-length control protein FliK, partial [Candidatus Poribacteria bacterium]